MYRSLEHASEESKNICAVNWLFFNVCNYSCSYCEPHLYDGSNKGPDLSVALSFIDQLFASKSHQIYFEFTGGEITLHPHFKTLFSHIKNKGGLTGIISNGSKSPQWWQEHAELLDHVCLSFHAERADKKKFYQSVESLHGKAQLHVNLMMLPERFEEIHEYASLLASEFEGLGVSLQPLFQNFAGEIFPYTDQQVEIMQSQHLPFGSNVKFRLPQDFKHKSFRGQMNLIKVDGQEEIVNPAELIASGKNSFKNWFCHAGIENLFIDANGLITRGVCNVGGPIGNISDSEIKFPEQPFLCPLSKCQCAFDIMSTKSNFLNLKKDFK